MVLDQKYDVFLTLQENPMPNKFAGLINDLDTNLTFSGALTGTTVTVTGGAAVTTALSYAPSSFIGLTTKPVLTFTYTFYDNGTLIPDSTGTIVTSAYAATAPSPGTSASELDISFSNQTLTLPFDLADYQGDTLTVKLTSITGGSGTTYNSTGGPLTVATVVDNVCFVRGTRIATPAGERSVEDLQAGDTILTQSGTVRPVKWIGRRHVNIAAYASRDRAAPIRIKQGAFGDNLPTRDLRLSPEHAVFVDGMLICARQLINGGSIVQERELDSVEYIHVELESHDILLAEGLPTESYLDTGNRNWFAGDGSMIALKPDFTDKSDHPTRETQSCAPFVTDAERVRPLWQTLSDRALALGYAMPTVATTTDADIHLLADGTRIDTVAVEGKVHSFMVPAGVTSVILTSRSVASNVLAPYHDDPRPIGVAVRSIVIRGKAGRVEFSADHPDLVRGWHTPEHADGALWRWTNGHAALPAAVLDGPVVVEVTVSGTTTYLLDDALAEGRRAA
jgi:hypothetical protein